MRVVVQVFALAEPKLEQTLDAYAACDVPRFVSGIQYQACVTPRSAISASALFDDETVATLHELIGNDVAAARRHPVFEFVETPPGKLTSRNEAHDAAVRNGADVIVAGDGDAPPADESYLDALLGPFGREEVVATNGFSKPRTFGGWLIQPVRRVDLTWRKPLYGRSSAISASGWQRAGPFRIEAIDQTNNFAVRHEEEFAFRRRLEENASVVEIDQARVYNDNRRIKCSMDRGFNRFGRPISGYCGQIGAESFHTK